MPLTAYLDETGHARDPNARYVGMAGVIAPDEAWEVFSRDWGALLGEYEVAELHMREFAHHQGEFSGWGELRRRSFLRRALEILIATEGMPFGSIVDLQVFNALDPRARAGFRDPYFMSLQICLHGALVYAMFEPPEERVAVGMDQAAEFAGLVPGLIDLTRRVHDMGDRLGDVSSNRARNDLPLQAADLVAYEFGHNLENLGRRPHLAVRWGFRQILLMSIRTQGIPWFRVWDAPALRWEERRLLREIEREEQDAGRSTVPSPVLRS